jgi:seryl-tRNA synthetase
MVITISLTVIFLFSIYLLLSSHSKLNELSNQYVKIEKIYEPAALEEKKLFGLTNEYHNLQSKYHEKLSTLKKNEKRLSQYYLGVGTTDSISYSNITKEKNIDEIETQLQEVKAALKDLVSEKKACICSMGNDVVVNGRKSEAKKLFNREIKLRLRCLDNEFKAAGALIDWNNVNRLIQRAKDTFNEINASGSIVKTYLQDQYLRLKIQELRLTYELSQTKQNLKEAEREESRLIREAEREEKRIKAAAEKAAKERKIMEKLVADELSKLESSSAEQKALYELHKQQLEELKNKEKRAVSLAQTTRAGYVYVISNKTSFGEGVVKIGMTRRADPNERVRELGDASVPEVFDVHAFAFTDDAPTLEKYLHNKFAEKRVNMVNGRKEFFYVESALVLNELPNFDRKYELKVFDEVS